MKEIPFWEGSRNLIMVSAVKKVGLRNRHDTETCSYNIGQTKIL